MGKEPLRLEGPVWQPADMCQCHLQRTRGLWGHYQALSFTLSTSGNHCRVLERRDGNRLALQDHHCGYAWSTNRREQEPIMFQGCADKPESQVWLSLCCSEQVSKELMVAQSASGRPGIRARSPWLQIHICSLPTAVLPIPKTLREGAHSCKGSGTARGGAGDQAKVPTAFEEGCVCPSESERNH